MAKCRWTKHLWLKIEMILGIIENVHCEGHDIISGYCRVEWRCNQCNKVLKEVIW